MKLGRLRLTFKRDDRIVKRYIDKDSFDTAAGISQKMSAFYGKEVSRSTVSRRLNECGYKALSPVVKPLISKINKAARLAYAEVHIIIWRHSVG